MRPHCAICLLSSESEFQCFSNEKLCRNSHFEQIACPLVAQVCGVYYTEVQEYSQTFGGSSARMQPRSMPRAPSGGPWKNDLKRSGLRLVRLSLAAGRFSCALVKCYLHQKIFKDTCVFKLKISQFEDFLPYMTQYDYSFDVLKLHC